MVRKWAAAWVCSGLWACGAGTIDAHMAAVDGDTEGVLVSELTFPPQPVATTSEPIPVVVRNSSRRKTVKLVQVSTAAPFAVEPLATPITLAPRATVTLYVTFTPTASGAVSGVLQCVLEPGADKSVPLSGTGYDPNPGVDTTPPAVAIASPTSDITYSTAQSVSVVASATDNVGITKVEFYRNGALVETDTSPPYQVAFAFTGADNGSHSFTAKAFDVAGNAASSSARVLTVNIAAAVGSAALAWDANTEAGLDGYYVYARVAGQSYGAPVATTTTPNFTVHNLALGQTYYFVVTAFDIYGYESLHSNEVQKSL